MDGVAVPADAAADFQQQCNGVLRNGGGAVSRNVGDRNAVLARTGAIDDIVTRGQNRNKAQLRAGLDDAPRNRRFVGQDDLRVSDARDDLGLVCKAGTVIDREITELFQA